MFYVDGRVRELRNVGREREKSEDEGEEPTGNVNEKEVKVKEIIMLMA